MAAVAIVVSALTLGASGAATAPPWKAAVAADEIGPRVVARLVIHPGDDEDRAIRRAGVLFEMAPGWHIYARNPGDTGLPTELRWRVEGGRVNPVPWPRPVSFREQGGELQTYGYEGRILLGAELVLPEARRGLSRVTVDVGLLACREECIPASFRLARDLGVGDAAKTDLPPGELEALFAGVRAEGEGGDTGPGPLDSGAPPSTPWMRIVVLALLGGAILNLMPCVLPVLALKVCALAEGGHRSAGERLGTALAYTAGVLVTMLVLAFAVLTLRAAGTAVGWGFQFQEPLFLAAISAVVVLFALNLLGVFEIGVDAGRWGGLGAGRGERARSFFEGLLAVLLATPCSAPFLGTAAGFAMAGSAGTVVAVFSCIGLGLAAPFVFVSAVPAWSRWLPRPGPWMQTLRGALGLLLLAAAVWLVWIFGQVQGAEGMGALLALLWAMGALAWVHGHAQRGERGRLRLVTSLGVLLVALGGLDWVALRPAGPLEPREHETWAVYAPDRVEARVRNGAPAFVMFTADWCLTCKVNERRVLDDERIRHAMAELGFARFRADWTRRDDAIRAELERFGRAGVPVYLLYPAGSPDAVRILPELLSVEGLLRDLERAAGGSRGSEGVSPVTSSRSDRPMGRGPRREGSVVREEQAV